jgi:hypothetical protein
MDPVHNSKARIQVADKRYMHGRKDGTAHLRVMNLNQDSHKSVTQHHRDTGIVLSHKVTTTENLSRGLFSIDDLFVKQGCSILLRATDYESGISEIHFSKSGNSASYSIPLRYDYKQGGSWLDYVLGNQENHYASSALLNTHEHLTLNASATQEPEYSEDQVIQMIFDLNECCTVRGTEHHLCHEHCGHYA